MQAIKMSDTRLPRLLVKSKRPFAIISADRNTNHVKVNKVKRSELLFQLDALGYLHYELTGHYSGYDEVSYLVPYYGESVADFKEVIAVLVKSFNQDCAIFSNGQDIGLIHSYDTDMVQLLWNDVSFDEADMTDGYSIIEGVKFTFASVLRKQ